MTMRLYVSKYNIIAVIIGMIGTLCAFIVPYCFPETMPCISLSYDVGFSNKVGIVVLAVTAALILMSSYASKQVTKHSAINLSADSRIPDRLVVWVCIIEVVLFALITILCGPYITAGKEASYCIPHVYELIYGGKPYVEYSFYYGPAMLYVPYAIYEIIPGITVEAAYMMAFALFYVVGTWMLADVVNKLRLPKGHKVVLFFVVLIGTCQFVLGMNYNLIRFVIAQWAFVKLVSLADRNNCHYIIILFSLAAAICVLSVSPEMGIVFCVLSAFYSTVAAILHKEWMMVLNAMGLLSILIGTCIFLPMLFGMMADFSSGVYNFPFIPHFPLFFFFFAVFYLSHIIGGKLHDVYANHVELFIMLIAFSTIPAALGRADSTHIVVNGWLIITLLYTYIYQLRPNAIRYILPCIIVCAIWLWPRKFIKQNYLLVYASEIKANLYDMNFINDSGSIYRQKVLPFNFDTIQSVTMPISFSSFYYIQLEQKGIYNRLYYNEIVYNSTPQAIASRVEELKDLQTEYLLLQAGWENITQPTCKYDPSLFLTYYPVKSRFNGNEVFQPLADYIKEKYVNYSSNGSWCLYKLKHDDE